MGGLWLFVNKILLTRLTKIIFERNDLVTQAYISMGTTGL